MKKITAAILLLSMLLLFCSCSGETQDKAVDLDALVVGITEKYSMTSGFTFTSSSDKPGKYLDEDLIASYYGDAAEVPDFGKIESYCVYIDDSNPKALIDVGVFKMKDASYSDTLMQYLKVRINDKIAAAHSYPDIDVEMLEKAVIKKSGDHVYYTVCYDSDAVSAELADALK